MSLDRTATMPATVVDLTRSGGSTVHPSDPARPHDRTTEPLPGQPISAPSVVMEGIDRRFGPTVALDGASLTLRPGEIHAVLGENGAGKTTLMRILAGLDRPDAGSVELFGAHVERFDPRLQRDRGVALVQQHFTLVPSLTAAQNLVLARPDGRLVRAGAGERRLTELGERYGLPVRTGVPAGRLSVGEQQRLELLRALDADARLLVLDEPTAVLTDDEATRLLGVCRRLADEGRTIAIITHRLSEVTAGCDRVTVLRAGKVVLDDQPVAGRSAASLAEAMVGAEVVPPTRRGVAREAGSASLVAVTGLSHGVLRDATLEVAAGEVLGIAGVDGNGQSDLEAVLSGRARPERGEVRLGGVVLDGSSPRRRIEADVAYIPSDRYRWGMVRGLDLASTLELGRGGPWRALRRTRHRAAEPALAHWDVRSAGPSAKGATLSGGNAQKLVLARELARPPVMVLACYPTRGLDPEAARTVAQRVLEAADAGAAVVWIGAELDELLAVSDRIVVLSQGVLSPPMSRPFDRSSIGLAMAGARTAPTSGTPTGSPT